jgi:hypothetical protein
MNKFKVQIDEDVIEGTATDIVKYMRSKRFIGEDIELEAFLQEIAQNAWRLYGKDLPFDPSSDTPIEYKCEQLVRAAIVHELLKEIK